MSRAGIGVLGVVLDVLLGSVEGLVLAGFAWEQDQAGLVGLEAGDVEGEGFLGGGLTTGVDGDADCRGEFAWDAGFLLFCQIFGSSRVVALCEVGQKLR